jgi:hypothetical protein
MIKNKLFTCLGIMVIAWLLAGCGHNGKSEIEFGTISNSVYTNSYFGMAVKIPADWSVQSQETQQREFKTGEKMLAGQDKNMDAAIKASELRVVNLFAISKFPKGTPVDYNPSLLSLAEDVHDMPGIKRGSDYQFHAKQLLQSGSIEVTFPKDIYTESVGGVDFDVMEAEMHVRGIVIRQKYYATIKQGYALCIIASFVTDDDEKFMKGILDTMTQK